jgi:hypothetical protein
MMNDIDFTHDEVNKFRMFGGRNGNKISIVHDGVLYMLKMPPKANKNPGMGYSNGCYSEYVACHIFSSLGIDTQETLLGRYKGKIAVACRDFETDGYTLKEFAMLKNAVIESSGSGYGTELSEILETIHEQQLTPPAQLEMYFWNMFIGDALLGNFDRHNGNWGFLVNEKTASATVSPIFDCGSCLYPQITDSGMAHILNNREEIEKRLFAFPTSALKIDDKKINYANFLLTTDNQECLNALKEIGGRIDLAKINSIIDDTPYISDTHKQFLKTMIRERKELIIDRALERVSAIKNYG